MKRTHVGFLALGNSQPLFTPVLQEDLMPSSNPVGIALKCIHTEFKIKVKFFRGERGESVVNKIDPSSACSL